MKLIFLVLVVVSAQTWELIIPDGDIPTPRTYHSGGLNKFGHFCNSYGVSSNPEKDTWCFDISNNTWSRQDMNSLDSADYVYKQSGVFVDDFRFIIVGGARVTSAVDYAGITDYSLYYAPDIYLFDLQLDFTWSTVPVIGSVMSVRMNTCVVQFNPTLILLYGGFGTGSELALKDFWQFNFNTARWTRLFDGPLARHLHSCVVTESGIFSIFGGSLYKSEEYVASDIATFNMNSPSVNGWIQVRLPDDSDYPSDRVEHSAIVNSDDQMVVFGGRDNNGIIFSDVWSFNFTSKYWTQLTTVGDITPRYGHTMVISKNDDIYVFGGKGGQGAWYNDLWKLPTGDGSVNATFEPFPGKLPVSSVLSSTTSQTAAVSTSSSVLTSISVPISSSSSALPSSSMSLKVSSVGKQKNAFVIQPVTIVNYITQGLAGLFVLIIITGSIRWIRYYHIKRKENASKSKSTLVARSDQVKSSVSIPSPEGEYVIPKEMKFGPFDFATLAPVYVGSATITYMGSGTRGKLKKMSFVVKQVAPSKSSEEFRPVFEKEISIMYSLRASKYFVSLIGWSNEPWSILTRHCPKGSLQQWMSDQKKERQKSIVFGYLVDISRALEYMHLVYLAHCDLQPSNVLLDFDAKQKRVFCILTDFGSTRICTPESGSFDFVPTNVFGTFIGYAAPEAVERARYKDSIPISDPFKIDLYSFAVLNLELLTNIAPWSL